MFLLYTYFELLKNIYNKHIYIICIYYKCNQAGAQQFLKDFHFSLFVIACAVMCLSYMDCIKVTGYCMLTYHNIIEFYIMYNYTLYI